MDEVPFIYSDATAKKIYEKMGVSASAVFLMCDMQDAASNRAKRVMKMIPADVHGDFISAALIWGYSRSRKNPSDFVLTIHKPKIKKPIFRQQRFLFGEIVPLMDIPYAVDADLFAKNKVPFDPRWACQTVGRDALGNPGHYLLAPWDIVVAEGAAQASENGTVITIHKHEGKIIYAGGEVLKRPDETILNQGQLIQTQEPA